MSDGGYGPPKPDLTEEDWQRIRAAIPKYHGYALDTDNDGTCVVYPGGAMHPSVFLLLLDDFGKERSALAAKIAITILERAPYDLGLTTAEVTETVLEILKEADE